MRTLRMLPVFIPFLAFAAHLAGCVKVESPASGSTVNSPVRYAASGTTTSCAKGVAAVGIYVDNRLLYARRGTSLHTGLSVTAGRHQTVVEEWDRCGGAS